MPSAASRDYPDIDVFFNPKSIALVGASADYRKLGYSILTNLLASQVEVYPVTQNSHHILGIRAYPSLSELPAPIDLAIVAVSAKHCPALMSDIRTAGARHAIIISGGFSETGAEGQRLENELIQAAHAAGVRVIGPNCVGVSNTPVFNGTFTMMPEPGDIALVSQSGALGGMLIYATRAKRIGMSKFASIGNAADVSFVEVLDYFSEDPKTKVLTVYIEGVSDGRALFESLKRASERKPVVVLKGGQSEAGSTATKSHTGSLAGSAKLFDRVLHQAGCVSAPTLDSLFEIAKAFDYQPSPAGRNVGIISNTGGAAVLAADALSELGLRVPRIEEKTRQELRRILSPLACPDNPVDVVASAGRQEYRVATECLMGDQNVDTLLVLCAVPTFAGMTATEHAEGMIEGIHTSDFRKPIVGVWMAGDVGKPGKDLLETNRVPCYDDPSMAALCIARTTEYTEIHRDR